MPSGQIKHFDWEKGFGFIRARLWFGGCVSSYRRGFAAGISGSREGQRVTFDTIRQDDKANAVDLRAL